METPCPDSRSVDVIAVDKGYGMAYVKAVMIPRTITVLASQELLKDNSQ